MWWMATLYLSTACKNMRLHVSILNMVKVLSILKQDDDLGTHLWRDLCFQEAKGFTLVFTVVRICNELQNGLGMIHFWCDCQWHLGALHVILHQSCRPRVCSNVSTSLTCAWKRGPTVQAHKFAPKMAWLKPAGMPQRGTKSHGTRAQELMCILTWIQGKWY